MRLGPMGATVSDRMDPYAGGRGSRALVAWLSVACTGLLLVALGNEAMHSWSVRLGDQGSVTFANGAAGPGTWKRQPKVDPGAGASDRTRSRVLIERRSHSDDECAPFGRVPIAVMIACHQRDQARMQRRLGRVGLLVPSDVVDQTFGGHVLVDTHEVGQDRRWITRLRERLPRRARTAGASAAQKEPTRRESQGWQP